MKFTPAVFQHNTRPAGLIKAAKDLSDAAMLITQNIEFSESDKAGGTIDWNKVYKELHKYSREAKVLASSATVLQTGQTTPTPTAPTTKISFSVIPIFHRMKHGMATCGLKGKPYEWPKGHFQAVGGDKINCGECMKKSLTPI